VGALARPVGNGLRAVPQRVRRGRLWPYLAALGPGIIAALASNDAGAVATYTTVGAEYGTRLLWVMTGITVILAVVLEMCARMGAVTGKGLGELIRERFGLRWAAFATLILFVANVGTTITEFVGIGAAAELFGLPRWLAVPPLAVLVWRLVTHGSYDRVQALFIGLSLVFLSYVVTVFLIGPDWGEIGRALVVPRLSELGAAGAVSTVVAMIGAAITPYVPLYTQAGVVEKRVTLATYKYERVDVIGGVVCSMAVAVFIILATATTLFPRGQHVATPADAALALEPVAGPLAGQLFGAGLFGASMLAAAVLPLATAYAVSEAGGVERGVSFSFREAPVFMGLFTLLVALGAAVAMIPAVPVVALLLFVQTVNGVLLPIELVFILLLVNDKAIMGPHTNSRLLNAVACAGVGVIILAVGALFATLVLGG
jgi:Mn2+/Fe2+ NRAMP family transporter